MDRCVPAPVRSTKPKAKVLVDTGAGRTVVPRRIEHVERVANRVFEARVSAPLWKNAGCSATLRSGELRNL